MFHVLIYLNEVHVATLYDLNLLSLFFETHAKIDVVYKKETVFSWRKDNKERDAISLINERIRVIDLLDSMLED